MVRNGCLPPFCWWGIHFSWPYKWASQEATLSPLEIGLILFSSSLNNRRWPSKMFLTQKCACLLPLLVSVEPRCRTLCPQFFSEQLLCTNAPHKVVEKGKPPSLCLEHANSSGWKHHHSPSATDLSAYCLLTSMPSFFLWGVEWWGCAQWNEKLADLLMDTDPVCTLVA